MRMRHWLSIAALTLGCRGPWPKQEPQPFPAGTYTFTLGAEEISAEVPADIRRLMIDTYVVTLPPRGGCATT